MIGYPKMKGRAACRQRLETFKGYNRNLRIGSGEFCEMKNLTADDYPVLSPRGKRGLTCIQDTGPATGMFYVPEVGTFFTIDVQVDHSNGEYGALFLLDPACEVRSLSGALRPGGKSFALMGRYLVIAPDMLSVELDTLHCAKIERAFEVKSGEVYFRMCREDGTFYAPLTVSAVSPDQPADGEYWLEEHGEDKQLRQYSAAQGTWVDIGATYTKIWGRAMENHGFSVNDTVTISGVGVKDGAVIDQELSVLNGQYVICSVDRDSIVVNAPYRWIGTAVCDDSNKVTIVRTVPALDWIVECGNRLWGCRHETNELYACKLGDFKNWNCFQGLSTDSWVGSVGTPGRFTGAVVHNGYPIFYKENCKHKVWPSATGAHQITSVPCAGVQKGSEGSLAVAEGVVFYQSPFGIFADDGGGPVEIGRDLGDAPYHNGIGTVHGGKYYLHLWDANGEKHLFVYDIPKRLWHKQTPIFAAGGCMGSCGEHLFAMAGGGEIWDLTGNTGTLENEVSWMAVTGDLGLELPEQKYITRLTLRLCLEPGATLEVYAQYDREQTWVKLGQVYGTDLRSISLPMHPRRCDQLRLKLQGTGMCKLYSITETLEKGSELSW